MTEPQPAPTDAAEDAAILEAVDVSIAEGGAEPVAEPYEPPLAPSRTDAAEDAEILAAADAAVEAERADPASERVPDPAPAPAHEAVAAPRHDPEPFVPAPAVASSGGSWTGTALGALLVLLAGGGLALWLAPKLAPHLPAGAAAWVSPVDQQVAGLQGEVAGLKAQLGDGKTIASQVDAATAGLATRLDGEIAALKSSMGDSDLTTLRQQLDRTEAAVQGQAAELGSLTQQLTGASGGGSGEIDVYRGQLDGLRAEMGSLSDKVAALATRIDEVGAAASRQIETAQAKVAEVQAQADTAALQADLAEIKAAAASGQPFAAPLDRLAGAPGINVPAPLSAAAKVGIPSMAQLRAGFADAAHQAIRASIVAGAGDGLMARAGAFLRAEVATRSLTPQEGRSPDAVLSRMEDKLRNDDLAGAIADAAQLPSEAQAAMAGWLDAARLRQGAEVGIDTLSADLPATN